MTNEQHRANMDRIQAEAEAHLKANGAWDDVVAVCEAIDNGTFTKNMFDSISAPDANPDND